MNFGAKQIKVLVSVTLVLLMIFSISFVSSAIADTGVPNIISYQGHLTDSGGNLLGGVGTPYYFRFSFYDSPTVGSGNKVWPLTSPSSVPLTVKQGSFNVDIGDTTNGYPDTLNYNFNSNQKVYLQIEISSDNTNFETLSPRSPITSAPFSQVSSQVNGTGASSFGTTTPITNSLISAVTTGINQVAMTIKGAVGQVANLFNITDSNGSSLFSVGPTGAISASSSLTVYGPATFYNTLNAGTSTISNLTLGSSGVLTSLLGSGLSNFSGELTVSTSTIRNAFSALGSGLSYSPSTGAFTNTGVTALGGTTNQINVSGMTGTVTLSLPQNIDTGATPTFASTTLSNFTAGSIPFFGTGGALAQSNSNLFWNNASGRLGIGTSTPSYLLDVNGNARIFGTLNLSAGNSTGGLSVNGAGTLLLNSSTGAGVNVYGTLAPSNAASTGLGDTSHRWLGYFGTLDASATSTFSGNVGIGTTNPATSLNIVQPSTVATALQISYNDATGIAHPLKIYQGTSGTNWFGGDNITTVQGSSVRLNGANFTVDASGNTDILGNVGIGTTTPATILDVSGVTTLRGNVLFGTDGTYNIGAFGASRPSTVYTNAVYSFGNVNASSIYFNGYGSRITNTGAGDILLSNGINNTDFDQLQFGNNTSLYPSLLISTSTSANGVALQVTAGNKTGTANLLVNGKIGIGSTTPSESLSVVGNLNLTGSFKLSGDAGTAGKLLQTTGSGLQWVATSSLGITANLTSLSSINFGNSNTMAGGSNATAIGYNNTAGSGGSTNQAVAIGINNTATANVTASVGNNNAVSNVFSSGFGYQNTVSGGQASGFGYINSVSADNSSAFGYQNSVSGTTAGAFGASNIVVGTRSLHVGYNNSSVGGSGATVLIGNNNIGYGSNTYVFGDSVTGEANKIQFGLSNTTKVTINNLGYLGLGSTTPSTLLSVGGNAFITGTLKLTGVGVGTLSTDANGNVTGSSDERLKNIQGNFTRGLIDLEKINPILYTWKPFTGYDALSTYAGFSAQNMGLAIPEAVATDTAGYLGIYDRPILATLVNAVKEIANKIDSIMKWFGGDGSKFNVSGDVCVDNVCVTKDQFKNMLQNAGGTTQLQTNLSSKNISEQQSSTSDSGASSSEADMSNSSSSTPPSSPSFTNSSSSSQTSGDSVANTQDVTPPPAPSPEPIENPAVVPSVSESPAQSPAQN